MSAAGYTGTPLVKKLGIKPGDTVALVEAPAGFEKLLQPLPDRAEIAARVAGAGVVVFFVTVRSALERGVSPLANAVFPAGSCWIAWPKRASGVATDITEDTIREVCLPLGLVDNKVCAIDETWSGLRLVWRRELRG